MLTFTVAVKLIGQPLTTFPFLQVAQVNDLIADIETSHIEELKVIREE